MMMNDICIISPLGLAEFESAAQLLEEQWPNYSCGSPLSDWPRAALRQCFDLAHEDDLTCPSNLQCISASVNGHVVGALIYGDMSTTSCYIYVRCIRDEYRGKGIFHALTRSFISNCFENKIQKFYSTTLARNTAAQEKYDHFVQQNLLSKSISDGMAEYSGRVKDWYEFYLLRDAGHNARRTLTGKPMHFSFDFF
jgi:ribosomal protein S18 acetylase RimI-like enzyme